MKVAGGPRGEDDGGLHGVVLMVLLKFILCVVVVVLGSIHGVCSLDVASSIAAENGRSTVINKRHWLRRRCGA